jgi:hypothetical protein
MSQKVGPTYAPTIHSRQATEHTSVVKCERCPLHPGVILSKPQRYSRDAVKMIHVICPLCECEAMNDKKWDQVAIDLSKMENHYAKLIDACTDNKKEYKQLRDEVASILETIQYRGLLEPIQVDDYTETVNLVTERIDRDVQKLIKDAVEETTTRTLELL